MRLSVCIITHNEAANIVRTLESVRSIADEIIVVDSHSTDNTVALAKSSGAIVFDEDWKGFAAQKNSCIAKSKDDWILSLDADEEVSPELATSILALKSAPTAPQFGGYFMARRNLYLNNGSSAPDIIPTASLDWLNANTRNSSFARFTKI